MFGMIARSWCAETRVGNAVDLPRDVLDANGLGTDLRTSGKGECGVSGHRVGGRRGADTGRRGSGALARLALRADFKKWFFSEAILLPSKQLGCEGKKRKVSSDYLVLSFR